MSELLEQHVEPLVEQLGESSSPSRWRFSITRLIVASAAAPLPLLLNHPEYELSAKATFVSSIALFAAILIMRADDLPRINLSLSFVVLITAMFGHPYYGALAGLPAMVFSRVVFPVGREGARPQVACDRVICTAGLLFLCVGLFSLAIIWMALEDGKPVVAGAGAVGWIVVLIANVYWTLADPHATLDERPDLGYRYELTMVLLPMAILFFLIRGVWTLA